MTDAVITKLNPIVEDAKFSIGKIVMTHTIATLIAEERIPPGFVHECLQKHQRGDWGDLCSEDKEINDRAVKDGSRILSSYEINGITIWIITECNREVTTALLPSDY